MSSESIYDVMYWDITNLVGRIKDAFPNHNQKPFVDKAICLLIDARRELMRGEEE
jgi:hypothetical protein